MLISPAALALATTLASADLRCAPQEGAEWSPDIAAVVCNGEPGFFVASPIFRLMQRPQTSPVFRIQALQLTLKTQEAESLREALSAGDRSTAHLEAALATTSSASRQLMRDYEDLSRLTARAWWESPALWLGVGFVGALLVSWAAANLRFSSP